MKTDLLAGIRFWVASSAEVDLPAGPPVDQTLRLASELRNRLRASTSDATDGYDDLGASPDVLHGLCELLDRDRDSNHPGRGDDLSKSYHLVRRALFDDEFDEGEQILARLAFLSWDFWRRQENHAQTESWQARCVEHVTAQDHVRNFLALPLGRKSAHINKRFLSDETVLLAVCASLSGERRNLEPMAVAREAALVYQWLLKDGVANGLREEIVNYLAAMSALAVAFSTNHVGGDEGRGSWIERARAHAERSLGSAPLLAMVEHARLITSYLGRAYEQVKLQCPELILRLEALGMAAKALRARLLQGRTLKELREWDAALSCLEGVHHEALLNGDLLTGALALCDRSEILSVQGRSSEAMTACRDAIELARKSDCRWVVANVQGTLGELLRDHGDLKSSIDAYMASVRSYEAVEMWPLAAYTRVVVAETMLLAGMAGMALSTIVVALPIIERESLTQEALVATEILREAIRRQGLAPDVLRKLREQLQRMKEEGRL